MLQIFFINITCFTLSLPKLPLLLPNYLPLSITLIDPHSYKSLVGALQSLTSTCLDLLFAVNQVCQFMTNPTDIHLQAAKHILRYLKCTLTSSILLKHSPIFPSAFSDADWVGDPSARQSTTGFIAFLGSNPITWAAKKQPTVSRSSTEAEYQASASTAAELSRLRILLQELHILSS